jgi:acyl carrier protein
MHADTVSDAELVRALLAVGADRDLTVIDFDRTFEELDLDSLARAELTARLRERSGVDVEHHVTATATPNQVRRFVRDELSVRAGL